MKKIFNLKGFTIVEVSLVLAIAGLIFLMVFIALPMLQRSARDAERREDMVFLANAIKKYQQNNRGGLPTDTPTNYTALTVNYDSSVSDNTWTGFYNNYLEDNFRDPASYSRYSLIIQKCKNASGKCNGEIPTNATFPYKSEYKIYIFTGANCDGGEHTKPSSNPRRIAIQYKLEGGGIYCGDL